jgi:hypothetical protein
VIANRRHAASCLLVAIILSSSLAVGADLRPVAGAAIPESVRELLAPALDVSPPAFDDPTQALVDAVNLLSRELGFPVDRSASIRAAGVPDALAASLATVTGAVLRCHRATTDALDGVPLTDVIAAAERREGSPSLDPARFAGVRDCAPPLRQALGLLELQLQSRSAAAAPPVQLDEWPVLHVDTSVADNTYRHDYAILVDGGGNDVYANNAGASLLDVESGPDGSAPKTGPALGCNGGAPTLAPGRNCSPAAAVLLDLAGDDTYGVFAAPEPKYDGICTADPLILRTVTIGAGVAGVGILRDVEGNDRYRGRTVTIGAAHAFGVGIVSDGAGNDSYLAIRNGEGFALVGGLGILHDAGGDDAYDWYMPSPLDPDAPNQTPGAGGVPDDNRVPCDNVPRFVQGAGNLNGMTSNAAPLIESLASTRPQIEPVSDLALAVVPRTNGTTGMLVDEGGNDSYRGVMVPTYDSTFGGDVPAGSQGFGSEGGIGMFMDGGGIDVYEGMPGRANDTTVSPGEESTGTGLFVDRAPASLDRTVMDVAP